MTGLPPDRIDRIMATVDGSSDRDMSIIIEALWDFDPVLTGRVRAWVECRDCGAIYAHQYQPYSLANPILTVPCGHDFRHTVEVGPKIALRHFLETLPVLANETRT